MNTVLLNEVAICNTCGFEYCPDMSHHNDTNRCDDCIEYEIDSVYSHRSYDNPYGEYGETEQLSDDESVCADCGEVFTVSEHSYGHYLCPDCYNSCDDNSYRIRQCNKCGNIYHPIDESDLHCVNCRGIEKC